MLVFKLGEEKTEIPYKDGASILLKRLTPDEKREAEQEIRAKWSDPYVVSKCLSERLIVGIKGFVDDNDKPIPFTDEVRSIIYNLIFENEETLKAYKIFLDGCLGNLKAGLAVCSTEDGTQTVADNASKTVKK